MTQSLLLLAVLVPSLGVFAERIQIRQSRSTGVETVYLTAKHVVARTVSTPGGETSDEYDSETWVTESVVSVEGDRAIIERVVRRVRVSGRYADLEMQYDSASGSLPLELRETPAFAASTLVGKVVRLTLDRSNFVVDATGWEAIASGALEAVPENSASRGLVTPDVLKHAVAIMFVIYPRWPLAAGDKWSSQANLSNTLGFSCSTRRENELLSISLKAGRVVATIRSIVTPSFDRSALGASRDTIDLAGEDQETIDIDLATGAVLEVRGQSTSKVNIAFVAGGVEFSRQIAVQGATTSRIVEDWTR